MAVQAVIGGQVAWVADNDPGASKILAHRYPGVPNLGDISGVDWSRVEPVDVLCAGFPCTDVSCAGARAGLNHGTRSGVWHHVATAIAALRPQLVVIENVRGLLTARGDEPTAGHVAAEASRDTTTRLLTWLETEHAIATARGDTARARNCTARTVRVVGARKRAVARCEWHERRLVRAIGTVLGSLASLGFAAEWTVLPASDVGAPHGRGRVFILAWPAGKPEAADAWRGSGSLEPPADTDGRGLTPHIAGGVTAPRPQAAGGGTPADGRGNGDTAEDADGAARSERRQPAPGQAEGGRARADAGRSGGALAPADTAGVGHGDAGQAGERGLAPAAVPGAAADTGDGSFTERPRDQGRPEGQRAPERGVAGQQSQGAAAHTAGTRCARGEDTGASGQDESARAGCQQPERVRGQRPADADHVGPHREAVHAQEGEPDATGSGRRGESGGHETAWGIYEPAIRRWEAILGRLAPSPTESGRTGERLSPLFVEWLMGLPEGWVTGVPGLSRSEQLKALGNGVVPRQAAYALGLLFESWRYRAAA